MIHKLLIQEEYGYRWWVAVLDKRELDELRARWQTMRGLHALVPVQLIIPQAREEEEEIIPFSTPGYIHCHIHEWLDSYLEGVDYVIPPQPGNGEGDDFYWFEMEGKVYGREDYLPYQ